MTDDRWTIEPLTETDVAPTGTHADCTGKDEADD